MGLDTKNRDKKVAAPANAPLPTWLKTWRKPSGVTTVCPACAPPLNRATTPSVPTTAA